MTIRDDGPEADVADRTVHASEHNFEVVRYDRAGKWYIEPTDKTQPRRAVNIDQAVDMALHLSRVGGIVHFGRQGGSTFDKRVRAHYG